MGADLSDGLRLGLLELARESLGGPHVVCDIAIERSVDIEGDDVLKIWLAMDKEAGAPDPKKRLFFRLKVRDYLEGRQEYAFPLLSFVDLNEFDERAVA